MCDDITNSPENIIKRLEELQLWKNEQQKILMEKQNSQRESLSREQKAMLQEFGLSKELEKASNRKENTLSSGKIKNIKNKSTDFDQEQGLEERPKHRFLKRGEGLCNRFKIHPDALRLHNLPKYKHTKVKKCIVKSNCFNEPIAESVIREETPVVENEQDNLAESLKLAPLLENETGNSFSFANLDSKELKEDGILPIKWAEVLNPENIEPIPVSKIRNSNQKYSFDDLESTSIFELLEKKVQDGSLSLDNSFFTGWVQTESYHFDNNKYEFIENVEKDAPRHVRPFLCESEKFVRDDSDESSSRGSSRNSYISNENHVRFSENVEINEVETDSDADCDQKSLQNSVKSGTKINFEQFKKDLFNKAEPVSSDSQKKDDEELIEELKKELVEKTDALKIRLNDLEIEIEQFKKHNNELIKFRQKIEFEKEKLIQDRKEMDEKINDEKIKIEIYLHDERMKIEEERIKVEKLKKEHRLPNRKERDEIIKLKEETENLQRNIKEKESKHIASQARLRAQIRNMEKEIKDLSFEMTNLKKENKRLESQNIMLNRQNNNKMLKEINKSIAKLAPKLDNPNVVDMKTQNGTTTVAKVKSHTKHKLETLQDESFSSFGESSDSDDNVHFTNFNDQNKYKQIKEVKKTDVESKTDTQNKSSKEYLKREILNSDGSKDIWYGNGNLKKISADGMLIRMLFYNKDIKETNITEGTVKYYYAETNTWHTTYLDGLEILEFPNGQTEHRYKDGTVEVRFPNGSIRISNDSDENKIEEWRYSDGKTLVHLRNGEKILSFPNGQKEIQTKDHKRREYPDGTVKIVYSDGSQETRYSNGRIRLKDKDGKLVLDSVTPLR